MDIRNSLDGLKSLLGVSPAAPPAADAAEGQQLQRRKRAGQRPGDIEQRGQRGLADGRRRRRAHGQGCRIQAALAAGTYSVPASAVCRLELVDAMLGG